MAAPLYVPLITPPRLPCIQTALSGEGFESIRIMRTTETFIILQVTISDFELFVLEPLFRLTRFIKRRLIL